MNQLNRQYMYVLPVVSILYLGLFYTCALGAFPVPTFQQEDPALMSFDTMETLTEMTSGVQVFDGGANTANELLAKYVSMWKSREEMEAQELFDEDQEAHLEEMLREEKKNRRDWLTWLGLDKINIKFRTRDPELENDVSAADENSDIKVATNSAATSNLAGSGVRVWSTSDGYKEEKLSEDVIIQMKALISRGVRRDRVHQLVYDAEPFGADTIQAKLLKASRNKASSTPLLDYILDSGDFEDDEWLLQGALQMRNSTMDLDPIGMGVACVTPKTNPEPNCGGYLHSTCKLIQSTCLFLGIPEYHRQENVNPFKKDQGCQCCSVALECVACASECGWNHCATELWTPPVPGHETCPPISANYFGREHVLRGFYN